MPESYAGKISEELIAHMKQLQVAGHHQYEIANLLGISQGTVSHYIGERNGRRCPSVRKIDPVTITNMSIDRGAGRTWAEISGKYNVAENTCMRLVIQKFPHLRMGGGRTPTRPKTIENVEHRQYFMRPNFLKIQPAIAPLEDGPIPMAPMPQKAANEGSKSVLPSSLRPLTAFEKMTGRRERVNADHA